MSVGKPPRGEIADGGAHGPSGGRVATHTRPARVNPTVASPARDIATWGAYTSRIAPVGGETASGAVQASPSRALATTRQRTSTRVSRVPAGAPPGRVNLCRTSRPGARSPQTTRARPAGPAATAGRTARTAGSDRRSGADHPPSGARIAAKTRAARLQAETAPAASTASEAPSPRYGAASPTTSDGPKSSDAAGPAAGDPPPVSATAMAAPSPPAAPRPRTGAAVGTWGHGAAMRPARAAARAAPGRRGCGPLPPGAGPASPAGRRRPGARAQARDDSSSTARRSASARASREFTVPTGTSSASAISPG